MMLRVVIFVALTTTTLAQCDAGAEECSGRFCPTDVAVISFSQVLHDAVALGLDATDSNIAARTASCSFSVGSGCLQFFGFLDPDLGDRDRVVVFFALEDNAAVTVQPVDARVIIIYAGEEPHEDREALLAAASFPRADHSFYPRFGVGGNRLPIMGFVDNDFVVEMAIGAKLVLQADSMACSLFGTENHIVTFDGVPYSFQGNGEYWLVNANGQPAGDFDVQVRLQPCPDNGGATTCATAFAIRNGDDVLEFERLANGRVVLRVNGELTVLSTFSRNGGDDTLFIEKRGTSSSPDGYNIYLRSAGALYQIQFANETSSFVMVPSAAFRGNTVGLCGNFNACKNDEFIVGGEVIQVEDTDGIYRFGKAYCVGEYDSMFFHRPAQRYPCSADVEPVPVTTTLSDIPVDLACRFYCETGHSLHGFANDDLCRGVCTVRADERNFRDVVEVFDDSNWPQYIIEPSYDDGYQGPSALFSASGDVGGKYTLMLTSTSSCDTAEREVVLNFACGPELTVDAGESQDVDMTPLGYPEVQMSANDGGASTLNDGRGVVTYWQFTALPLSVVEPLRRVSQGYSANEDAESEARVPIGNATEIPVFSKETCASVFSATLPDAEILAIFEVAQDLGHFPDGPGIPSAGVSDEDLTEFLDEWCPVLFDGLAPLVRDNQSAVARWVPDAPGVYTLVFAAADGCQLAQDSVSVTVHCPDCLPQASITLENANIAELQILLTFDRQRGLTPSSAWDRTEFAEMLFGRYTPARESSGIEGDFPQTTWSLSRLSGEREVRVDSSTMVTTVIQEDGEDPDEVAGLLETTENTAAVYSNNFDSTTEQLAALRTVFILGGSDEQRVFGGNAPNVILFDNFVPFNNPPFFLEYAFRQWAVETTTITNGSYSALTIVGAVDDDLCRIQLDTSPTADPLSSQNFEPERNFDDPTLVVTVLPDGEPLDCEGRYRVSLDAWGMCARTSDFLDFEVSCGAPPVAIINSLPRVAYQAAGTGALSTISEMSYLANFVGEDENLDFSWTLVSVPERADLENPGVTISEPTAQNTDVTFDFGVARGGFYGIQLEVSNGCQTGTARREVEVVCDGVLTNVPLDVSPVTPVQFTGEAVVFALNGSASDAIRLHVEPTDAPDFPQEIFDRLIDFSVGQVTRLQAAFDNAYSGIEPAQGVFTPYLGGTYSLDVIFDDGCDDETLGITLAMTCQLNPTGIEFDSNTVSYAIDSSDGRVYLDAGTLLVGDTGAYDPNTLTEFEWVFVSYPGMADGQSAPNLQDGNTIVAADPGTDYDFYSMPGSDVALPLGAGPNFFNGGAGSRNPCATADCTSFAPSMPGVYELALVYYDGCSFLASGQNLVVDVAECTFPSIPVIDPIDPFTIGDDPTDPGAETAVSLTSTNTEDFAIAYEWQLVSAPERSTYNANPLAPIVGDAQPAEVTEDFFTPDVEGTYQFMLTVWPLIGPASTACAPKSATVDVVVDCGLFLPFAFPMVPSLVEWNNVDGQFPVVSLSADVGEVGLTIEEFTDSFDYFWSVSRAPDTSTYRPLCYDGTNRGQFSDGCQATELSSETEIVSVSAANDLPDDVLTFEFTGEGTTTLTVDRDTTRTQRYQSFVELPPVPVSLLNTASYRRFESIFFPDVPGVYELTLRVESDCRSPVYEQVTVEARCTVLADGMTLDNPVSSRIGEVDSLSEHRYSLDASSIYSALGADPLVADRVVFWWDWMFPGPNPDDDITVNPVMYARNRRIYDNVVIYNNDRPVASFKATAGPGVYPARLTVTDGCNTREFELNVNVVCAEADQQASGDQAFGQIQEGVAGVSAITVDLEQFVATSSFCEQQYHWELIDFDPVADPINPQPLSDDAAGRSAGRWLAVPVAVVAAWLSWSP